MFAEWPLYLLFLLYIAKSPNAIAVGVYTPPKCSTRITLSDLARASRATERVTSQNLADLPVVVHVRDEAGTGQRPVSRTVWTC